MSETPKTRSALIDALCAELFGTAWGDEPNARRAHQLHIIKMLQAIETLGCRVVPSLPTEAMLDCFQCAGTEELAEAIARTPFSPDAQP